MNEIKSDFPLVNFRIYLIQLYLTYRGEPMPNFFTGGAFLSHNSNKTNKPYSRLEYALLSLISFIHK